MTIEINDEFLTRLEQHANAPDIEPDTCELSSAELLAIAAEIRRLRAEIAEMHRIASEWKRRSH